MKIDFQNGEHGVEIVDLQGDLDFHSSPELRRELVKLVEQEVPRILVDLKNVSYIDSSGLATFVELFQKMKRYGGKLVLFNLSQGVRSVFEIAKLDTIFQLAENQREALALVS